MILVDLNVVLDVVQHRDPHYHGSAAVIDRIVRGEVDGCLPAHAFTTVHFLVGRYRDAATADRTVDWLLRWFEVAGVSRGELERARALAWTDFEDAVVAAAAEAAACVAIRGVGWFRAGAQHRADAGGRLAGRGNPGRRMAVATLSSDRHGTFGVSR